MQPLPSEIPPRALRAAGFSLQELILTLALVTFLCVLALMPVSSARVAVIETKLRTDVVKLNQLMAQYISDGGSFGSQATPQAVLDKLKTVRPSSNAKRQVGVLTGRYVDVRLALRMQSASEAARVGPRAVWNNTIQQFEITATAGIPGIKNFVLDDSLAGSNYATESRTPTAVLYNDSDGWVWRHDAQAAVNPLTPMVAALNAAGGGSAFDPIATPPRPTSPPTGPTPGTPPGTPLLTSTGNDEVTGPNSFMEGGKKHWHVTAGADQYAIDKWERPTAQSYQQYAGGYATQDTDYYGNLDIAKGSVGYDTTYLYFEIELWSNKKHSADGSEVVEGLIYDYRIRLGMNASGAGSYLLSATQPASQVGTTWGTTGLFGYRDSDNDLGSDGNGYETSVIADGKLVSNNQTALFARINPLDDTKVQFALLYAALAFTQENIPNLGYVVYEASKGTLSTSNYLWNNEYTSSQAGSPNAGSGGLSEFGTQGLGAIYEVDTWRGTAPTL